MMLKRNSLRLIVIALSAATACIMLFSPIIRLDITFARMQLSYMELCSILASILSTKTDISSVALLLAMVYCFAGLFLNIISSATPRFWGKSRHLLSLVSALCGLIPLCIYFIDNGNAFTTMGIPTVSPIARMLGATFYILLLLLAIITAISVYSLCTYLDIDVSSQTKIYADTSVYLFSNDINEDAKSLSNVTAFMPSNITYGRIVGTRGPFNEVQINVYDGVGIIFGRGQKYANLVFPDNQPLISRKHCSIRLDGNRRGYYVKDFSSNGTYYKMNDADKTVRLEQGKEVLLMPGTVVYLGSEDNAFMLDNTGYID